MKIKVKLKEGATMPTRATDGSAGLDLYCLKDTIVYQGRGIIKTGVAIELPMGYEATVRPRSGFSLKGFEGKSRKRYDCDVKLGTIDSDYRDDIGVIVQNNDIPFWVEKGTRIAQMVISPVFTEELENTDTLTDTERGTNGFGSSGTK